jgi:hypothetical protein
MTDELLQTEVIRLDEGPVSRTGVPIIGIVGSTLALGIV